LSPTDIHFKDLSPDFVLSAFTEGVSHIQDNFDLLNDVDFTDLGDTMGNEPFENSNSYPHEQLNFQNQLFQEATTSLPNTNTFVDAASQVSAFQVDDAVDSMSVAPPLLTRGILQPQLNQSLPADWSDGNQVNGRSKGTLPSNVMQHSIESTLSQHIPVPLQTSMVPLQTQAPQLNADEKLTCNRLGCSNIQFERKCDWQ